MRGRSTEVAKGLESGSHSELGVFYMLLSTTTTRLLLFGEGLGDVVEGEVVLESDEGDKVVVLGREGFDKRHGP